MQLLFDGDFRVHYSQAYVRSRLGDIGPNLEECFVGQSNGILGAASPGRLWLTTGLHSGRVRLRMELHDAEPPIGEGWEDVIEASFTPSTTAVGLYPWGSDDVISLPISLTCHRVRYCASEMDAAKAQDTVLEDESTIDSYALVLWPRAWERDRVLRQTSAVATYWHSWASRS